MSAYDILAARGVTRLCHFTKFQSLTHIITCEAGVLASSSIRQDTKNVTDKERYDGELNYVCCSVQYPNSWFLEKAMHNNTDRVFKEWVVLYIDLGILKYNEAKFCPCNASTGSGMYINAHMEDVGSIFADSVPMWKYPRSPNMLQSCPTNGQAEILIKDGVRRDYIIGIAVGDDDVAGRVFGMLKYYGIENIPVCVAPDVITKNWSSMIRNGRRPTETTCVWPEED